MRSLDEVFTSATAQGKPFPYEQLDRVGSVMFPYCLLFFNMGEG